MEKLNNIQRVIPVVMAVKKIPGEISSIRALLAENPEGLTIISISELLGMNRNAVANNLKLLRMQGRVALKQIGPAKIYWLANKLPVDAVLKLSNNGVIVFSKGETVADMNETFREFLQVTTQDLVGKNTGQLPCFLGAHPELPRLIREGLKGKESRIHAELALTDRSQPCTITIQPVFFESGDSGVALIADISAGTRYSNHTDDDRDDPLSELDMTEYICRFTPDGKFTYVNRAYSDLLHKAKADLIGHRWRPTVPESEYQKIKKCLISLDSAHPVASLEFKVVTSRGDSRWQRWKFRILPGRHEQAEEYMGTGSDITEIKIIEEQVRKGAEEREGLVREREAEVHDLNRQIYDEIASHEKTHFQLQFTQFAMDKVTYMIAWINREGRFVYMNRETQDVLGYRYRDMSTKKIQDIIGGAFSFPWDEIWESIKLDRNYTLETVMMTRKGNEVPVEMVLNYLEFKDKQYCCCFAKDITRRKQAEESLRETNEYLNNLFDYAHAPIIVWDPAFVITRFNHAFEELTSRVEQEVIGQPLHILFPEESRETSLIQIKKTLRGERWEAVEIPILVKDGSIRTVIWNSANIRDTNGRIISTIAQGVDITERKLAEEALRESEKRYHTIYDQSPIAIELYDAVGTLLHVNPACLKLFGIEDMQAVQNFSLFADPNINNEQKEQLRRGERVQYQGPFDFEKVKKLALYPTRRKGIIWLDVLITPIKNRADSTMGFLVQVQEFTDRKIAEVALQESEWNFHVIFDRHDSVMLMIEPVGGKILDANPAAERFYGRSKKELCAQSIDEINTLPPGELAAMRAKVAQGGITSYTSQHRLQSGDVRTVEVHSSPITMGGKTVLFSIIHDITGRKQVDEMHGEPGYLSRAGMGNSKFAINKPI